MSVNYHLFRVSLGFFDIPSDLRFSALTLETALPFGSQQEIIDWLCAISGFEHADWEDEFQYEHFKKSQFQNSSSSNYQQSSLATIYYKYHQKNDSGRVIEYCLQSDPVICISTRGAYPEDFLPVVDIFSSLAPFVFSDPYGGLTNPNELFYSFDGWIQKNYEEDAISFKYG